MKTIPQIEAEINKYLDRIEKLITEGGLTEQAEIYATLAYIKGIEFVLDKKERLSVSDKTRERLIKAIKEYRNEQG